MTKDLGGAKTEGENTKIYCVAGFGSLTSGQIKKMADIADGVTADSEIVKIIYRHGKDAPKYVRAIKAAIK